VDWGNQKITTENEQYFTFLRWLADNFRIPNLLICYEDSDGYPGTYTYNEKGLQTRYENSRGYWEAYEYNEQGLKTRFEDSNGNWKTCKYAKKGNINDLVNVEVIK
jgi:hypothetical protein